MASFIKPVLRRGFDEAGYVRLGDALNMDFQSCDEESNCIEELKHNEKNFFMNNENFEKSMKVWHLNVIPIPLKLIAKDAIRSKAVCRELEDENFLMMKNQDNMDKMTLDTLMRDLEQKETTLKTDIENIVEHIEKLKSLKTDGSNLKYQRELEIHRNFAKISKELTCTNFVYKGSNIQGLITTDHSCEIFDLSPHDQDVTKYLWECLDKANTKDSLDIFNNDNM